MTIDHLAKIIQRLQSEGRGNYDVSFILSVAREGPKNFPIRSWAIGRNYESGDYELHLG